MARSVTGRRVFSSWMAVPTAFSLALSLAACGQHDGGTDEHRFVGDANFVVVEDAGDVQHATPLAEHHCAQFGKVAHFREMYRHHHGRYSQAIDVRFDCVPAA